MELIIDGYVAVGVVDIGNDAVDRYSSVSGPITLIDKNNPSTRTGKITSVEIYALLSNDLENCEVASFYRPDPVSFPNKFTTRDNYTIGAVTGGSKQTKTVDLDIEKGDYIGITFTAGSIEYSPVDSGYLGVWSKSGDNIPCTNTDFGAIISGAAISLKAINPTGSNYIDADCEVIVNEYGDDFFGIIIDGDVTVIRDRVEACLATSKGIRLAITIDGEDVTNAVTGTLTINHSFNKISSFSLTLADAQYSPLVNAHIDTDVEIIITAFVEGEEFKLFTGLVDTHKTKRTKDFKLSIVGRGYGRKLLDKRMTLVSVQDSAAKRLKSYGINFLGQISDVKRVSTVGAIIEFLAAQAGITNMDVPVGDEVTIEHSFQDQSIWDMIQKECELMGWFVRFDEEAKMIVGPKVIKTNETKYPNPDWSYDEGEFVELGFNKTTKGIINKVIVMGTVFEEEIVTVHENEVEDEDWEPEDDEIVDVSKEFAVNECVDCWSHTETVYETDDCKITVECTGSVTPPGYIFPHFLNYRFKISGLGTIKNTTWTVSGGATIISEGKTYCNVQREREDEIGGWPPTFTEKAFTIAISIKVGPLIGSYAEWIVDSLPAEEENIEITYKYTQIKATCQDSNSIAEYGERQPQEEYTINRPLAETEEQCKRIGNNKILDSHRFTHQPDILVNFNPLLTIGQTISLTDTKIGYNGDRRFVAQISHAFPIDPKTGAIKPRTKSGCVFYA